MWKSLKAVSELIVIPSIEDGQTHERRSRNFGFSLTGSDINFLTTPSAHGANSQKSLRLFCTSSDYYPSYASQSIPLEYPFHSEIILNSQSIPFKKGLKGKAGTAAPVNLDVTPGALKKLVGLSNLVTFSHQGPSINKKTKVAKKFYVQVCMTETWTAKELLNKVLSGVKRSAESILSGMKEHSGEDDIEVGSSKMSLKCPLSYIRIQTPVRSTMCTHLQCFEIDSWLQINEQTPQWQCPTCERELPLDKIFIDGFFQSILSVCPDTVDEVIVEADGEWHTEDSKYGSDKWMAARALAISQPASAKPSPAPGSLSAFDTKQSPSGGFDDVKVEANGTNGTSGMRKQPEVFVLDEDDSDDDLPLRNAVVRSESTMPDRLQSTTNLTPLSAPISRQSPATTGAGDGVIDLTLDSDDDEQLSTHPPPPHSSDLPAVSFANGARPDQNGSNKRPRDWMDDRLYGSESSGEDYLYSPRPARNRVYDEEDNLLKRPRLSTTDSYNVKPANGSGLRGGGTSLSAAPENNGLEPSWLLPPPPPSPPPPPPPGIGNTATSTGTVTGGTRSPPHDDTAAPWIRGQRPGERPNVEHWRLPALQSSDRESFGSTSPGPRTPELPHPGTAPMPKWQPIGISNPSSHRTQNSTSTVASGSTSYSSYRTAPQEPLVERPPATPLGRTWEQPVGQSPAPSIPKIRIPLPKDTLPKRY